LESRCSGSKYAFSGGFAYSDRNFYASVYADTDSNSNTFTYSYNCFYAHSNPITNPFANKRCHTYSVVNSISHAHSFYYADTLTNVNDP
jgi:hypothetical protein